MYLCAVLTVRVLGKFTAYKLNLRGLPIGNHHFEYAVDSEFFRNMESADIRSGNVDVELDLIYDGNAYSFDFSFKGEIIIACDRCLDDMPLPIDTTYHLTVKYGDSYDEKDDLLIIPESDSYFNVAYTVYDSIALEIPLRHVHPAGQCNKAMAARLRSHSADNEEEENDGENNDFESNDPRWDALRDLLDNK